MIASILLSLSFMALTYSFYTRDRMFSAAIYELEKRARRAEFELGALERKTSHLMASRSDRVDQAPASSPWGAS